MIRWHATIRYRSAKGIVDVEHDLEELYELHDIVERGPHWDTIDEIIVRREHIPGLEKLTIEKAEKL